MRFGQASTKRTLVFIDESIDAILIIAVKIILKDLI